MATSTAAQEKARARRLQKEASKRRSLEVARAYRLRGLMRGPQNPTRQVESIQEIIDERIAELNAKLTPEGD